ncbi:FMN-binding negative transcriptional regulator [Rhodoferax sp.]|uniref:FMN-binding negative transcriptional regulator n=1 Tax=Rhodoferax sp. TaxID=50421 RepID=UPI00344DB4C6
MYLPKHFEETRPEVLHAAIAAHPLASLVTVQNGVVTGLRQEPGDQTTEMAEWVSKQLR